MRVARTCVTSGYLPASRWTARDAVLLRVAGTLLDAPRPSGPRTINALTIEARNQQALVLTREALADPALSKDHTLVVLPHTASLASTIYEVMAVLGQHKAEPVLLLPLGEWAAEVTASLTPTAGRVAS